MERAHSVEAQAGEEASFPGSKNEVPDAAPRPFMLQPLGQTEAIGVDRDSSAPLLVVGRKKRVERLPVARVQKGVAHAGSLAYLRDPRKWPGGVCGPRAPPEWPPGGTWVARIDNVTHERPRFPPD